MRHAAHPDASDPTDPDAPTADRAVSASPRVWAVGGGKGGVGKSVVTSGLAIAFATEGPRVALVDADLGGANLHTLLGVPRPKHTLADFMNGGVRDLAQVLCPTAVPGLSLVSGARAALEVANPKHAQKLRLLRHLRRLPVAHVLLDLGAGSSFNVLDLFVAADERVMVVVPEPTSIENAYHFLKAAFFRSLRDVAQGEHRKTLESVIHAARRGGLSPREMVDLAGLRAPAVGRELRQRARELAPRLLVNMADDAEDRRIGHEMSAAARRHLGARLDFVGALALDAAVPAAVARQQPVLQLFPGCPFSRGLQEAAERLLAGEMLGVEHAPPRWRVRRPLPPVATHGLGAEEVALPRLERAPPPPPPPLPLLDLERPGRSLRRCREHLGVSLRDLEERTRIRHLDAIESERWAELPPAPYLEGQVRCYAEALGIHEAVLLASRYAQAARESAPEKPRGLLARLRRAPGIDVLPRRAES